MSHFQRIWKLFILSHRRLRILRSELWPLPLKSLFTTRLNLDSPPINENAILGITTIREKITFLVDLFSLAEQVSPERFKRTDLEGRPEKDRLLVVEDTPFFSSYFESVGFRRHWQIMDRKHLICLWKDPYYNLVVSDIVMPVMDGYELVKSMKSSEKLARFRSLHSTSFTEEESREKLVLDLMVMPSRRTKKIFSDQWNNF